MKVLKNLLLFLVGIWLVGCASSGALVNADYDRETNFKEYLTYTIEPTKSENHDPILNSELNQKRITKALSSEMNGRGYVYKEENPDLIIRYHTDVRDKQDVQTNNNWGYYYWWRNNTQVRNYEEARLIIDMIDADTKKMVWQGWASGEADQARTEDRDRAIRETVALIMKQYPHRANKNGHEDATSSR